MRALAALAAVSLVACAGCADSDGLLVVVVETTDVTLQQQSQSLHVDASIGMQQASRDFSRAPSTLSYPESFAIQTPASYRGSIFVVVSALDATGLTLATTSGSLDAHPSETTTMDLVLFGNGLGPVDGGAGDLGVGSFLGPGERCDATLPCTPGLVCGGLSGGVHHCLYPCVPGSDLGANDCPPQTECTLPPHSYGAGGYACMYVSKSDATARQPGEACTQSSDHCVSGYICGASTCDVQCDGPGAACPTGTCQLLAAPGQPSTAIAFTCQP